MVDLTEWRESRVYKLTPRELEVSRLLKKGKTNLQIADALGIKLITAKLHVSNLTKKVGAKNRVDAVGIMWKTRYDHVVGQLKNRIKDLEK